MNAQQKKAVVKRRCNQLTSHTRRLTDFAPVSPMLMSIIQRPKHLIKAAIIDSKNDDSPLHTKHGCATASKVYSVPNVGREL